MIHKKLPYLLMGLSLLVGPTLLPAEETEPPEEEEILDELLTLPYLRGYNPAPAETGVTIHDRDRTGPGVNLAALDGPTPVVLMDLDGEILHEWTIEGETHARRAHLFPDGDLLAILEKGRMVKLDKDSVEIWRRKGGFHHDLEVTEGGEIYVIRDRQKVLSPAEQGLLRNQYETIIDNLVTVLSPEGKTKEEFSIFDAIVSSDYAALLQGRLFTCPKGDILHTNTIELIKEGPWNSFPPFREGHILVSFRHLHAIAVIDPELRKVTWAAAGMWAYQHQPTILENGNVLIFDNQEKGRMSRVFEFDPATREIAWAYRGTEENGFFSEVLGSQQRLPNGNTLITESCDGRVFEVAPDGEIVWEYLNPRKAGEKEDLAGIIYEMLRLDSDNLDFLGQDKTTAPADQRGDEKDRQ